MTKKEGKVQRSVNDLGVSAYLLMHKYEVVGRKGKSIYFEINDEEVEEFERKQLEYLSSQYHQFDSCLMSLKKLGEYMDRS